MVLRGDTARLDPVGRLGECPGRTMVNGKSSRKQLVQLAQKAHDRELGMYFSELETHFREWRERRISPAELSDSIHAFHDGWARAVYKTYALLKRDQIVAHAIAVCLLNEDEVSGEIRETLAGLIAHFREDYQIDEDDPLLKLREQALAGGRRARGKIQGRPTTR